jgi:hypothetical protein
MGETIEIFVRIIIYIISKFISVHWRAFDWAEKTSGNSAFDLRYSMNFTSCYKRSTSF